MLLYLYPKRAKISKIDFKLELFYWLKILHLLAVNTPKENPDNQPFIESQIKSLRNQGIDCDIYEILSYNSNLEYLKAIGKIRDVVKKNNYDIIHAHYSYSGLVSILARTGKPILLSLMGSDIFGDRNLKGKLTLRGKLDRLISKYITKRVNHVIIKSENMKEFLPNVSLSVVPNGVNFNLFKPQEKNIARNKLGLSNSDFTILFLGNPNYTVKNFKLAQQGVDSFCKMIHKHDEIKMLSPFGIEQTLVADFMNASDVLILTSFFEGSPNIVKEAMACNLPIISTDVGDVKDVISDTENCFVVDYSANEIASKLKIIFENRRRSNGREKIKYLGEELVADKIGKIYKKLLGQL